MVSLSPWHLGYVSNKLFVSLSPSPSGALGSHEGLPRRARVGKSGRSIHSSVIYPFWSLAAEYKMAAARAAPTCFTSYDDWPPNHPPFVSHDAPWCLPAGDSGAAGPEPTSAESPTGPDPGFQYMVASASAVFAAEEVAALVAAAGRSNGLVDTPTGSLRVMDAESGREAARITRDPMTWDPKDVHGRLLILYGPYAVAAVRARLGNHAPEASLPHLEEERAIVRTLSEVEIPRHRFRPAWRIRWVEPASYGEGYFTLEETAIPQLWWPVAQNVIVPLKVVELASTYPDVYGRVLDHERMWGAAGHIAWTLSKNEGDLLSGDKIYRACMAGEPPLTDEGWPDLIDREKGWPAETLVEEAKVMGDAPTVLAIMGKRAASNVHACVPPCLPASPPPCLPASLPAYMHTCIRAYVHACVHACRQVGRVEGDSRAWRLYQG